VNDLDLGSGSGSGSDPDEFQLSNSELRAFKGCRRRWALTYVYGYGPDPVRENPTGVTWLGNRVHAALEAYYALGIDPVEVVDLLYTEVAAEQPFCADTLGKERVLAALMVQGYLDWVAEEGIDAGLEVLSTEHEMRQHITLRNGTRVVLRGKLDQVVRRRLDGSLLLRDFKTVGTLSKAHLLILDEQMRFYALLQSLGARETGDRADGALYTMLLRSKRTSRATGPFYEQVHVSYNTHDLTSMWHRVHAEAEDVMTTRRRLVRLGESGESFQGVAYPTPSDYCSWGCSFVNVCPLFDDGSRAWDALGETHVQRDPYDHYERGTIDHIRDTLGDRGGMSEERGTI